MSDSPLFAISSPDFHRIQVPVKGSIVGYTAIAQTLRLDIPIVKPIALVSSANKRFNTKSWKVLPNSYLPEDKASCGIIKSLYNHLVFALKYEGVNLLVFKKITTYYSEAQLTQLVSIEPTGQYSRRIWCILEWLMGKELEKKRPLRKKSYVHLVDPKQQYCIEGTKSPRHLVINNLPGTPDFCPLIRKTTKLEKYEKKDLPKKNREFLQGIPQNRVRRAASFLLLKDSKASFSIEGESPKSKRAANWGRAIGQAGARELNREELLRLQKLIITNKQFVKMGLRTKGGFVGEHDRVFGTAIPSHISAKPNDLPSLIKGLIDTNKRLINSDLNPVIAAATIAFGFVFIHPFVDGNGRIHRYLIHHVLARKNFSQQGMVFPISSSILDHMNEYRETLEAYSHPLLEFIEWNETKDHNIEVLNDTVDYYRFYDSTTQAEFLYDCVLDTIENIIPQEVAYLAKYDEFKERIYDALEIPDRLMSLLAKFLEQNDGSLSKRAKEKEFAILKEDEIKFIESVYREIFK